MTSAPSATASIAARSRIVPSRNRKCLWSRTVSRFSRLPWDRSSRPWTSLPRAIRRSARLEPTKPATPVTAIFITRALDYRSQPQAHRVVPEVAELEPQGYGHRRRSRGPAQPGTRQRPDGPADQKAEQRRQEL